MNDYDAFADDFAAHAADNAFNAHYDRPAMLELLGPIDGLDVLDAGCGPGLYVDDLLARGAQVTGFDSSGPMIALARSRAGSRATFHQHDLNRPLDWAADETFEGVPMALVLHHLEDPVPALRELHRVLRPGGKVVLSTVHPLADWQHLGGSYFTDEMVEEVWSRGWRVHYRRAPLHNVVADFTAAGFVIETLIEPQPAATMKAEFPEEYEELTTSPFFIAFQLAKSPTGREPAGR